ncbi:Clavaminate synthase-like protein [Vararia minispora EC-137]|uniref:Clavaminate synthase-like protein n=1 Tax=Vararia minispora EC-137 TaxID=1314806 RepID=A0ACB8QXM1_9AGAM|nr:Clavaminate synthase-like protein [Vararia minispora EC-137]
MIPIHDAATFSQIPIIDLALEDTTALVAAVRDACVNVGFLYVRNHGISPGAIAGVLAAMQDYFSLPLPEKAKLDIRSTPHFKGYNAVLTSNNDPAGHGDLHEGFEFGFEPLEGWLDADEVRAGAMEGRNVWPDRPEEFREACLTYYHEAFALGRRMYPLFAQALGLAPDFFDDKTRRAAAIMRVLHYPPQPAPDEKVLGIGAHTDFECFTVLWQQPGIQALQVCNAAGEWIDAPPLEGTLVVNLGDQFARWTNDVFKSTVHRAANLSGARRYSIPLFFGTDYDVLLEPIPSCISEDRPPRYEVVTAGEHVKAWLEAAYGHKH